MMHKQLPCSRGVGLTASVRCTPRPHRCAAVTRAAACATFVSPVYTELWKEWAPCVSGEWDGVSVAFAADGSAQQLPDYYVPQAYRDWGVELYDWQTQCSCCADDSQFKCLVRRLMPTVGCEADAVAFTEDVGEAWGSQGQLAVLPDGSYSAGPLELPRTLMKTKLETCLALPAVVPGARPSRIKVVANLTRHWSTMEWTLASVELHKEVRDGPYTGRKELAGCGGGQAPISKAEATSPRLLGGSWEAPSSGVAYTVDPASLTLTPMSNLPHSLVEVAASGVSEQQTMLPLGAWSRVRISGENITAEAGVLLPGSSHVRVAAAVRSYVGGTLSSVVLGQQAKVPLTVG